MTPFFFPSLNILKSYISGHVHMAAIAASTTGNAIILFTVHYEISNRVCVHYTSGEMVCTVFINATSARGFGSFTLLYHPSSPKNFPYFVSLTTL
jgi:hypothetical protein